MPRSVLVVDDSVIARKLLIKALPPEWSVTIAQAANGQEALAAFQSGTFDLVFLDLNMPVMDGYELLEMLGREHRLPMVIVLSGDIQPKAQERVRLLGARAFLRKPASAEDVAKTLQACGAM